MKEEIIDRLRNIKAQDIKEHLIGFAKEATLKELKELNKIINKKLDAEVNMKFGDLIVPKEYFYSVKKSGILEKGYDIIDVAAMRHPIATREILILCGFRKITHKLKLDAGKLLTLAGFKKVSTHRPGQTPTKAWVPADKHVEDSLKAEYFFSLLMEHEKLADTKALDDLI